MVASQVLQPAPGQLSESQLLPLWGDPAWEQAAATRCHRTGVACRPGLSGLRAHSYPALATLSDLGMNQQTESLSLSLFLLSKHFCKKTKLLCYSSQPSTPNCDLAPG